MGHKNKLSLVGQIKATLDDQLAIGRSKHQDKLSGEGTQGKIYSWETYRSYMKHANYFAAYCKEKHRCKTLDQCRPYVNEWLDSRSNLSPYTVKLEAAALAKIYCCSTSEFAPTKARKRQDISRSRGTAKRDYGFSLKKNRDIIEFCRSTGARRSELTFLTGDALTEKDGQYYIHFSKATKGGRPRLSPVIGDVDLVVRLMNEAGSDRVFVKIPSHMDVHGYRADYATRIYQQHARPIEQIPYDRINPKTGRRYQSDVYYCRGDRAGTKLDKVAMKITSEALGHSRISVIAGHYLRIEE